MTLLDYQVKAARTIGSDYSSDQEMHAVHGMIAETAEFLQCVVDLENTEHIVKELGDLMWMLAEYCTSQGWSMKNIHELAESLYAGQKNEIPSLELVIAIGELNGLYQKSYQGHVQKEEEYRKALAKVLHCTCCMISRYTTLEEVMQTNIDKLLKRYPNGFDTEKSQHREEGDI